MDDVQAETGRTAVRGELCSFFLLLTVFCYDYRES